MANTKGWVDAKEGNETVLAIVRKHGGGTSYGQTTAIWMTTSGYDPSEEDR